MTAANLLEEEPRRPIWLVTLADLMLLLVGFFVFLQANQTLDSRQIANGLRAGFGVAPEAAMPVAASRLEGFAVGSAALPPADAAIAWAQDAARDPRVRIEITGGTDGSTADVDAASGSAAILAADRARALAEVLAQTVPPAQLSIATRPGAGRAVQLDLAFVGQQP
jgi:hypothetical protein